MNVLINNNIYPIEEIGKSGREGEICRIGGYSSSKLAKIYDSERLTEYIQHKITAFISKFENIDLGGVENFIAFPEVPIYEAEKRSFCGFVMKNFNNHTNLFDHRYDINQQIFKNENVDDYKAVDIITALFTYIQIVHKAGFILGDINPENILVDNKELMPVLVDFDSAQLGAFYSNTNRKEYIDPTVKIDGYSNSRNKYFLYTTDSDIYSMSILCYEFIIGVHPYFFQTSYITDTDYHKNNNISFIDYIECNTKKTDKFDFEIIKNDLYMAVKDRLFELRETHNNLYIFFKSIFCEGKRFYFSNSMANMSHITSRNNIQHDHQDEMITILQQSKNDPEELELFAKQFDFIF